MQGKILGFKNARGTIRGEDGKRYKFGVIDVQNAQDIDIETLSGSEVDFEVDGSEAVEIFVTKFQRNDLSAFVGVNHANPANLGVNSSTNLNTNSANSSVNSSQNSGFQGVNSSVNSQNQNANFSQNSSSNFAANAALIKEIKHRFAISLIIVVGVVFLIGIPVGIMKNVGRDYYGGGYDFSVIFQIIFFSVYLITFGVLTNFIKEKAKSADLLTNFVASELIPIFAVLVAVSIRISNPYSESVGVWAAIILIAALFASLFVKYRYYKELAQITAQPLFLYAFWCNAVLILCPIGFVLWLVAWFSFKEFNESENKDWFLVAQSAVEPLVMDFYEQLKNGNANEEFTTQKARQIAEMVMEFESLDVDTKLRVAWGKIFPLKPNESENIQKALDKFDDKIREFIKEMSK